MAFKHKVTEEEYNALPEPVQAEYKEQDGAYYVQVEGMVPKARVDEFRSTNINLMKENDDMKTKLAQFGDITAEDIAAMQKRIAEGGDVDEEHVEAEVAKRVAKMQEKHQSEMTEINSKLHTSNEQLSKVLIDNELSQAAVTAGVRDTALQDVVLSGRQTFVVEQGVAVAKTRNEKTGDLETVYGADGATPQSIPEWLAERATDRPHWFKESTGAGGQHQSAGGGAPAIDKSGNKPRGMQRAREVRSAG